jgi:hypothetical protein
LGAVRSATVTAAGPVATAAKGTDTWPALAVYELRPDPCQSIINEINTTNSQIQSVKNSLREPSLKVAVRNAAEAHLNSLNLHLQEEQIALEKCIAENS